MTSHSPVGARIGPTLRGRHRPPQNRPTRLSSKDQHAQRARDKRVRPHIPRDPQVVKRVMTAVRSTGNRAECLLGVTMWSKGLRYRKYRADLPGCPDFVFKAARVVVFVDGDFWHARVYVENGLDALRRSLRTERAAWWVEKLRRNATRDRRVTHELRAMRYTVIRVWERDVLRGPEKIAARVARLVRVRLRRI